MELQIPPLVALIGWVVYLLFMVSGTLRGCLVAMFIVTVTGVFMFRSGYLAWHFANSRVDTVIELTGLSFFYILPIAVYYCTSTPRQSVIEPKLKVAATSQVFRALKHGPLAPSQICNETLYSMSTVNCALADLRNQGYAKPRPEPGFSESDPDCPWGLCAERPS